MTTTLRPEIAEILLVLARNAESLEGRVARAYRDGLTVEELADRLGIEWVTARLYYYVLQNVMEERVFTGTDSNKLASYFMRDALNYGGELSGQAIRYAKDRIAAYREVDASLLATPLRHVAAPLASGQRRPGAFAATCPECLLQHAGECL